MSAVNRLNVTDVCVRAQRGEARHRGRLYSARRRGEQVGREQSGQGKMIGFPVIKSSAATCVSKAQGCRCVLLLSQTDKNLKKKLIWANVCFSPSFIALFNFFPLLFKATTEYVLTSVSRLHAAAPLLVFSGRIAAYPAETKKKTKKNILKSKKSYTWNLSCKSCCQMPSELQGERGRPRVPRCVGWLTGWRGQ